MPAARPAGLQAPAAISPRRPWVIIGLLCLGMIFAYFDRVNLSVALALPEFKSYFALTDQDRGALNSAFFWSYAVLQIPAGWFVDRYGVKYPYAAGFLLWSLISAATAVTGSMRQLFVFRVLLGFGESVVRPAGMRWIRFHCAEHQRGLAVGLYMAAAKIGPAVGAPLATALMVAYGWRMMFVILGLGCLFRLIPWLTLVKNDHQAMERGKTAQAVALLFAVFSLSGLGLMITGSYEAPMQATWFFLIAGVAAYAFLVRRKYAPKVE